MMNRKDELLKIFNNVDSKELVMPLIMEALELETKINEFRKVLSEINIDPTTIKKYKFYHSCYKDYLTQYTQVVKTLMNFIGKGEDGNESPLREYFKRLNDNE